MKKDTIYIDLDDEITTIIDKVRSSDEKIIALVLPKRANVLHSIVNMRLLKRTADSAKKKIVLITSEQSLLPLAGVVGLHTARNLQSKPEVPTPPPGGDEHGELLINDANAIPDETVDAAAPVGELAAQSGLPVGTAASAVRLPANNPETETIELDSGKPDPAGKADGSAAKEDKPKRDKKLAVPNFDRFRLKFFLVLLALALLIGGYVLGFVVLPKAAVTVQADIKEIPVSRDFTASPAAKEFSLENGIVPATRQELKRTETEKYAATGELDKGTKATGTVTITNCTNFAISIPAGTGVSSGDLTSLTDETVYVPPSTGIIGSGACKNDGQNDVDVTAIAAGDKYNLSARSYTIAGQSASVTGKGTAMSGGTSKIAKVISQGDFDAAKQKLLARNTDDAKQELEEKIVAAGLQPISETFAASPGDVTTAPKVNEEAAESTATVEFTFTMLGVKKEDLKQLVEESVKDKYDKEKQKLYKDGLSGLRLKIDSVAKNGDVPIEMTTNVSAGPQLDEEAIRKEVAGKKSGEAKALLESRPGVKEASIRFSPFWVYQAPKDTSKISVTFNVPETNAADGEDKQ